MRFETLVEKECEFIVYHILYHQLSLHVYSSTNGNATPDNQKFRNVNAPHIEMAGSNFIPENIKVIDFNQYLWDHYFTRFRL